MFGDAHTILLVDDEYDVITAMRRTLSPRGYRILEASRAAEALKILTSETVDVIVSDVDMPEMSGLELMAIAREMCPHAARIMVTGRGTVETATRAINEGEVHRFLHKPFDPDELRAVVAEAIDRQRELALATEASRIADVRRALLAQLEAEHPGITQVDFDADGEYVLDPATVLAAASSSALVDLVKMPRADSRTDAPA